MHLKSLELHGFKSFSEKTTLHFDSPVTVIVGPNGSGKSNITDAMRWVLGELSSKSIRGTKMEDVIFVGTDSRKPMQYAEVSVTFDNSERAGPRLNSPYDEVTVSRRYYRSGESEYYLNKKAARLKDIHELFMNTGIGREGYSIIGQGKIAEIISKKSEDRRTIFEEAAGISKFKYKKNEAERRLLSTEDNMLRASDILGELRGRIDPLEREAAKARKYLDLFELKKRADVSLWLYDSENIRVKTGEFETAFKMSEHELEMCEDTIAGLESSYERMFGVSQENKLNSEKKYTELREKNKSISSLEAEYRVFCNDREHYETLLESEEKNRDKIRAASETFTSEYEKKSDALDLLNNKFPEYEGQKSGFETESKSVTAEYEVAEKSLASLLSEQKNIENSQIDLKVRLSVMNNSKMSDADRNRGIADDIAKYEAVSSELIRDISDAEQTAVEYKNVIVFADEKIALCDVEIEKTQAVIAKIQSDKNRVAAQIQALGERIIALKKMDEHFEGYQNGVKFVMQRSESGAISPSCGKIFGPVSKLIKVKDEHIIAVETALGASLQNIVVESEETAKVAIKELKRANAGRATFYPITSVKSQGRTNDLEAAAKYAGFVGYADSLVSRDEQFSEIILSLLGRTAVFDNIDNASETAKSLKYRVRIVTLDGQQINVGGSFTGGSVRRDSGMLTRGSEISKLENSRADLEKTEDEVDVRLKKAEIALSEIVQNKKREEEQKLITDTLTRAEISRFDSLSAKLDINENLLQSLKSDAVRIKEQSLRIDDDIKTLQNQLTSLDADIAVIAGKRAEIESERYALEDRLNAISDAQNEYMIRFTEYKKDIEAATLAVLEAGRRCEEIESENAASEAKSEEYRAQLTVSEKEVDENRQSFSVLSAEVARLEEDRASLESGSMDYEQKLNELRLKIKESSNKKENALRTHGKNESKLNQLRGDFDKMSSRLWDEYELTRSAAVGLDYPLVTEENRTGVASSLNEYKSKLRAIGSVNMGAIEEYAEVKGRFDFLNQQIADLDAAKVDLTKIITELEKEMRVSFMETFNKINENFAVVFRELFGGGNAEIVLTDPEDVLTSGIEIKAAPPGKMIKNLMLLSGGEQAFVAIALLFAILKANPSPFCIFDEIEAALDEVNVDRFAEYIKHYSDNIQFVIITHRRGTMEIAEKLYGVTMPERGVSKVLSMDLSIVDSAFLK